MARRADRGGQRGGRRPACAQCELQPRDPPPSHHPDPPGVGLAAGELSGAGLRPRARQLLPVRRRQIPQAARRDLRRRFVADGVLSAHGAVDALLRRHAPVRAAGARRQGARYAAPGAGALRLPQRHVLSHAEGLSGGGQVLRACRHHGHPRCEGSGRQACQRARPVLLRQRAGRDCAPSRELEAASLPLHPDHGGPRPLRLCLHAGGRRPRRRGRHASGDARVPAPPRHDPDGLRPSARRARAPLPRPAVPHHALRRPPAAGHTLPAGVRRGRLRSRTCCAAEIRPRSRATMRSTP